MTLRKKILIRFEKKRLVSDAAKKAGVRDGLFVRLACALLFALAFSATSFADELTLDVTYGYQNTAKAGRFLPLAIQIENSSERTFSGFVHVYMAESENSVYEYAYPVTVEGASGNSLEVTVSLSSGINQLLVTAVDAQGEVLGSKRVGLNVAGSDAELIVGVLSDTPEHLSYLSGVGISAGALRTRIVNLNPDRLPRDEMELDQLDVLLVSNFDMEKMSAAEAATIGGWVEKGGVLLLGSGARGNAALAPYFDGILKEALAPSVQAVDMGDGTENEAADALVLAASAVHLEGGQELLLSGDMPLVAEVNIGAGVIAVSGYDFCDIGAYSSQQLSYIDRLFSAVLGQNRLQTLAVSASERSSNEYEEIEALMRVGDMQKLPNLWLYGAALSAYVLLVGPGLYFFLRERSLLRVYSPAILLSAALGVLIIWVLGINTRFNGPFLRYAKIKNISAESIAETDFINLRSPYSRPYELNIKTEYDVYPVVRGSDFNGDITALSQDEESAHTLVEHRVDRSVIQVEKTPSFKARYFELTNNIPNVDGSFSADLTLFDGTLSGTITNQSVYALTDAALLLYGRIVPLGRLDAGAAMDVQAAPLLNVPVSNSRAAAALVTTERRTNLLRYYIENNVQGYFSDVRLVGFLRSGQDVGFTEDGLDSEGTTMLVSSLQLKRRSAGAYEYHAVSRDPFLISGDYDLAHNTISGTVPTIIEYRLGEENRIERLRFECLPSEDGADTGDVAAFDGSVALYNNETDTFETVDIEADSLTAGTLAPYLSGHNALRVRYLLEHEDALRRAQYLPVLEVTAEDGSI